MNEPLYPNANCVDDDAMNRIDREWLVEVLVASAWAALVSAFPSTLWELFTAGDPLESTRAAGAMLISYDSSDAALITAACVVHVSVTLFWAAILAWILPRKHIVWTSIVAAGVIAFIDLQLIARFFFPDVYVLEFWPQFADHIAWAPGFGSRSAGCRGGAAAPRPGSSAFPP